MKKKIRPRDLPDFSRMGEQEIAAFWEEHEVLDYWELIEPTREDQATGPKRAISIRMDEPTLAELKRVASRKGIGYQTLMRIWIKERLAKESRENRERLLGGQG